MITERGGEYHSMYSTVLCIYIYTHHDSGQVAKMPDTG